MLRAISEVATLLKIFFRSSHWRCSVKIHVLKSFTNFTGKHLCWSLFFNKDAGLKACKFIKKRLPHRCFPVKFTKFLRTLFFQNTSGGCFWLSTHIILNDSSSNLWNCILKPLWKRFDSWFRLQRRIQNPVKYLR